MRVLVVDDSAVVRQAMQEILGHGAGMEVAVAADPLIAMSKMKQARPDVIVLDLEMPRMDGLTFLRKLMAEDPIPVVITYYTAWVDENGQLNFRDDIYGHDANLARKMFF